MGNAAVAFFYSGSWPSRFTRVGRTDVPHCNWQPVRQMAPTRFTVFFLISSARAFGGLIPRDFTPHIQCCPHRSQLQTAIWGFMLA